MPCVANVKHPAPVIRKPVAAVEGEKFTIKVVCDDGSVWMGDGTRVRDWMELPPVPGTRRWHEK